MVLSRIGRKERKQHTLSLLDTTQLEFHTLNLSECGLAQIVPGQPAVVMLKAYPNEPIEATVMRIGFQAGAPIADAATFPVILSLSETDLDIRPGMTGPVEIRAEEQLSCYFVSPWFAPPGCHKREGCAAGKVQYSDSSNDFQVSCTKLTR